MKANDDAAYYLTRAKQEEEAARKAATALVASLHRDLADRYWVIASGIDDEGDRNVSRVRD